MIKFDKLKIVSRIENVSNINESEFQSIVKDGIIHELKYSIQSPFSLYIEIDYIEKSIELINEYKLLNQDGLLICESDSLDRIAYPENYQIVKDKKYGDKWVVILKQM